MQVSNSGNPLKARLCVNQLRLVLRTGQPWQEGPRDCATHPARGVPRAPIVRVALWKIPPARHSEFKLAQYRIFPILDRTSMFRHTPRKVRPL